MMPHTPEKKLSEYNLDELLYAPIHSRQFQAWVKLRDLADSLGVVTHTRDPLPDGEEARFPRVSDLRSKTVKELVRDINEVI